ncbi:MAG TPA: hypothetical protein VEZ12_15850 [Herpetosiphonaceae bacterium]|nr:hypothetical protein [Herpetosiphonaceae bacterium]
MGKTFAEKLADLERRTDLALAAARAVHDQYREAKSLCDDVTISLAQMRSGIRLVEDPVVNGYHMESVLRKVESLNAVMRGEI